MIHDPDFSDWVAEHGSDDSFDSRGESEGEGEGVACAGNERDIARLLRAMVCLSNKFQTVVKLSPVCSAFIFLSEKHYLYTLYTYS